MCVARHPRNNTSRFNLAILPKQNKRDGFYKYVDENRQRKRDLRVYYRKWRARWTRRRREDYGLNDLLFGSNRIIETGIFGSGVSRNSS